MLHLYKYIALGLAFLFVAVIKSSPLAPQMSFLLAVLIIFAIIYIVMQRRRQTFNMLFSGSAVEVFFISSIILFMIELTGGPSSQLYFLNYFLLFGLPLISTPKITLLFAGFIFLYYIPDLSRAENTDIFLKLGSVLLLLPLAYFFSNEVFKRQELQTKSAKKLQQIREDAEALEVDIDDPAEREKLDEIISATEDLEKDRP